VDGVGILNDMSLLRGAGSAFGLTWIVKSDAGTLCGAGWVYIEDGPQNLQVWKQAASADLSTSLIPHGD
jgi:hypothetical protein